jgi:signal transduction histidine kinase
VIGLLATLVVIIAAGRLEDRLVDNAVDDLAREARLIATQWRDGVDADALADTSGTLLNRRITLIDPSGQVIGDSDFDDAALQQLQNHAGRPEVREAMLSGTGTAQRSSVSAGDEELYVAVKAPRGIARVSISTSSLRSAIRGAQRDVLVAAAFAMLIAIGLSLLFARQVSRPIIDLRDVARSIAAGDLQRRPQLSATGEVGDLADALARMTEQLVSRMGALETEDALMSTLFESLNEGVMAVSADGTVMRMNERARVLLGLRESTPFPSTQLPRDRALRDVIAGALRGEVAEPVESEIAGKTLSITARPLRVGGAVVAFFDLTSFRRLETMRRDFVANVSHELRTPLTVISGFAETLADSNGLPEQEHGFAEAIHSHAVRMQQIVDDLLDLSRIESGGWLPQAGMLNIASVATEVLASFRSRAQSQGLELRLEVDDAPEVYADSTALRQILANLVSNAVRHTASGSITVWSRREPGGVAVGLRDTGAGIGAEHLPRIFERFYRADAGRSRESGGTGLGLAIVRHLTEAHGGHVTVESTVGVGTTILAHFPDPPPVSA